ncbi:MAG: type II toxin-antitoxin system HicA family toxin [Oscillospiraceae bacterium]|nr:type II toxin-antitoxin system HicA family toxin [Oscillospiraceae bacterium]
MKLPRDVDADQLVRVLVRCGYSVSRQTGSHIRLQKQDGTHQITIPNHSPIKIGTLQSILKDVCRENNMGMADLSAML